MVKNKKRANREDNRYSNRIQGGAWLRLFAVGFLVYAIAAGFGGLKLSAAAIREANPVYLVVAAIAIAMSYVFAATTYMLLSTRPIRLLPTLLVQITGGLVNRMLPAGLGGMGLNVFYLKKSGHTVAVATVIAATNNALGFIGNIVLIAGSLLLFPVDMTRLSLPNISWPLVVVLVVGMSIVGLVVARRRSLIHRLRQSLFEMVRYVRECFRRPVRSFTALCSSILLTALHAAGLYYVLLAVGDAQSWTVALMAISVGAFVGAATPTPGGLGGAEAGIAGVLMAFAVPVSTSVAAALVYRGITYWLPLLPGYLALRIVEKRYI